MTQAKATAKAPDRATDKARSVMDRSRRRNHLWTYQPYEGPGDPVWAVMAGDLIIGLVKERADADAICRARVELNRMTVDARRQGMRIRALGEENRMLMATLRRITDIMQRAASPMEMINAKSEVTRVLKKLTQAGR